MGAWSHHASRPGVAVTSVQDGVDRGELRYPFLSVMTLQSSSQDVSMDKESVLPGNKPLYHIVVLYERMVHL